MIYELKQGLRQLKIQGLTATVSMVAVLALSLAILLSVSAVASLTWWQALPYSQADNLRVVEGQFKSSSFSMPAHNPVTLKRWLSDPSLSERMTYASQDDKQKARTARNWHGVLVDSHFFQLLGVTAMKGRLFREDDAEAGHSVVISHRVWKTRFGGRADIVGQVLELSGQDYQIIGVLPERYRDPPGLQPADRVDFDYYRITDREQLPAYQADNINIYDIAVYMRAMPNESDAALAQELNQKSQEVDYARFFGEGAGLTLKVMTLQKASSKGYGLVIAAVFISALALLLITVINLLNLYLSRAQQRTSEWSIKLSLGAKPHQLMLERLGEALAITLMAFFLALLLSAWSQPALRDSLSEFLPVLNHLSLDPYSILIALVLSLFIAAIFAWLPSRMLDDRNINLYLHSSGKGTPRQLSKVTNQRLILIQVVLTSTLVLCAHLPLKNAWSVINRDLGFKQTGLYQVDLGWDRSQPLTADELKIITPRLEKALLKFPGIKAASVTSNGPIRSGVSVQSITTADHHPVATVEAIWASPNYLSQIHSRLIAGRYLSSDDSLADVRKVVVDQHLARQIERVSGEQALGAKLFMYLGIPGNSLVEVVGIVANHHGPGGSDDYYPTVFSSQPQVSQQLIAVVESALPLAGRQDRLEKVLQSVAKPFFVNDASSVKELVRGSNRASRLTLTISIILAAATLLLANMGIYGVLSMANQSQRYEMGIRMSLGAKQAGLRWLMMRYGLYPSLLGLAIALGISLMVPEMLDQDWHQWLSVDPVLLSLIIVTLLSSVILACYLPARALLRNDPIKALRNE
ncbi:ABC transporter permease [Gallaecimonas kandeliae]|uniref:FtsX-like permease family protein n=1 Tax=Gallaecimonas kandeliae TaxID=3029055 RepID=UPI0026477275|nr:FtsX-like permease family protein [Gallaecimonas kandeliae]WKE65628.1 ABC transporter permease [Gallaecimonas kandeliae]